MAKNKFRNPQPEPEDRRFEPVPEPELVSVFEGKPLPKEKEASKSEEAPAGESEKARRRKENRRRRRRRLRTALDGSLLESERMRQVWGLVAFAFVLALLMITANYMTERIVRESTVIKGELQDLHFRRVSTDAELMKIGRQSSVARMLDSTGVKESLVPPFIIK